MTPQLHSYPGYGWLRGFNIIPSWGARIEDAWWFYDGDRMREEAALVKPFHANCIRLWIEFTAWIRDPEQVQANFMDAIAAIDEAGMKVMPCLFNRWHDNRYDYGGTYMENLFHKWEPRQEYIRALVEPLAGDERVLIWDLCNEPQAFNLDTEINRAEFAFLERVAAEVRACGVQQPVTMGTMTGTNIDVYAPLLDVLCGHPYAHDPAGLQTLIEDFSAKRTLHGKPFLVNETIPGSLNDAKRAEVMRFYTAALEAADMGWMGWAVREGLAIATRRDRYDMNGIDREGFHPYFTAAGEARSGLEFLREEPKVRAPWE